MDNTNIATIDDMIKALNKAKLLIGGNAPINVVTDHGILNLTKNDNFFIGSLSHDKILVINTGDWDSSVPKTMDL